MEIIKKKLNKITDFWNHFLLETKELQRKIRFNEEIKTNYYGDILFYFTDTFDLLQISVGDNKDFQSNIFFWIGFLQIIYVHQDLIDELLLIFKLNVSCKSDKNPNREIRNELVGHPICRDTNHKLRSSVIFGRDLSEKLLHYIKYYIKDGFIGISQCHDFNSILERHKKYLNKYLDLIWEKIKNLLIDYRKQLKDLVNEIGSGIRLEKILDLSERRFERIFNYNCLFKRNYLVECEFRQKEHFRYKNAVNLFISELTKSLKETVENINELINTKFKKKSFFSKQVIDKKVTFEFFKKNVPSRGKKNLDYRYMIGKLYEKDPVFGISFFKEEFKNNKIIIEELENMEQNYYSDVEYYCSFEVIRLFFEQ